MPGGFDKIARELIDEAFAGLLPAIDMRRADGTVGALNAIENTEFAQLELDTIALLGVDEYIRRYNVKVISDRPQLLMLPQPPRELGF